MAAKRINLKDLTQTFDPKTEEFTWSIEASTLSGLTGEHLAAGSYVLVSEKTGEEVLFEYDLVLTTKIGIAPGPDRELLFWVYTPSKNGVRKHPKLDGTKFIVFND